MRPWHYKVQTMCSQTASCSDAVCDMQQQGDAPVVQLHIAATPLARQLS